jgi:hypothetical protein
MTLGEFRTLTKDYPDNTDIVVWTIDVSDGLDTTSIKSIEYNAEDPSDPCLHVNLDVGLP